jgi:hypothetical protein
MLKIGVNGNYHWISFDSKHLFDKIIPSLLYYAECIREGLGFPKLSEWEITIDNKMQVCINKTL